MSLLRFESQITRLPSNLAASNVPILSGDLLLRRPPAAPVTCCSDDHLAPATSSFTDDQRLFSGAERNFDVEREIWLWNFDVGSCVSSSEKGEGIERGEGIDLWLWWEREKGAGG